MKKNIVLINQVTGPLFIDIINEYVKKYKNNIVLITGSIEKTYADLSPQVKVIWKTKYKRKNPLLRITTWLLFFFKSFYYLLFTTSIKKVILVTNPPVLPFLGLLSAGGKKFIYDIIIYDIFPEALVGTGHISKKSIIYKFWKKINKKVYNNANKIFTISHVMKKVIENDVSGNKLFVVHPWTDTSFIRPIVKRNNPFVKKYGLLNKIVVLYSGNMGATHDLITVLKAAKHFNDNKVTNIHFLFIGDGVQKNSLLNFSKTNKLMNVTFLPFQNPNVLPYSFASADIGIVTLGEGSEQLSVPSKTYYYLAAGLAIVSVSKSGSEMEHLVKKYNCGVNISPGDYSKIIQLLNNTSFLDNFKKNSLNASKYFSLDNAKFFV